MIWRLFVLLCIIAALGACVGQFVTWFGEENGTIAFAIALGGAVVGVIAFNTWRDLRARVDAAAIVAAFHKGQRGPFTRWFHGQKRWTDGDRIPLGRVPGLVASAYNGIDRVAVLFREGFTEVVAHDLVGVLGDNERATRAFIELQLRTERRPSIALSLIGLLVAGKMLYDVSRDQRI